MINTKGVDKKTTVLDYVVKAFFEKEQDGEQLLVSLQQDLAGVDECARLNSNELGRELDNARRSYSLFQEEIAKLSSPSSDDAAVGTSSGSGEACTSPSGRRGRIEESVKARLGQRMGEFEAALGEAVRSMELLGRKTHSLLRYFAEPVSAAAGANAPVSDTSKVWQTLQQFRRALDSSVAATTRTAAKRGGRYK